jgi:sarcosine oxidase subunit gamma
VAEAGLATITALAARAPRTDRIGNVMITENPDVALASVTERRGHDLAATRVLSVALPGPGGHATGAEGLGALWLAPASWMIEAPLRPGDDLAGRVKSAVGAAASVTDQTDAWVCFDIDAADAGLLFERLCPLDTRSMDTGCGSRSVIEHIGCLIICRDRNQRFSVFGPRSSAGSLHHALVAAAAALASGSRS